MKHTPGPWRVREERVYTRVVTEQGGEWIANLGTNDEKHLANARLIAAAPELLEACEAVLDVEQMWYDVKPMLIAAIAKATGEGATL